MHQRISSPRLIGRDLHLQRLRRLFAQSASSTFTLALIKGDAGIGKSRLVQEFASSAPLADALTLRGSCFPIAGEEAPYGPLVAALRDVPAEQLQAAASRLPQALIAELKSEPAVSKKALSSNISAWLQREVGVNTSGRDTEWSAKEIYVALPRPGGDAWLSIERDTGAVSHEVTDRGWIAYLNDLHKGRHTGKAWSWFIDLFAGAAIIFCLTGLLLLQLHAKRRRATWPIVGMGLIIPTLLVVLFIHR